MPPNQPKDIEISDVSRRHQDSVIRFPTISLSEHEYVISKITRHAIGTILPIVIAGIISLVVVVLVSLYPHLVPSNNPPFSSVLLPAALFIALVGLTTYIVIWTYQGNCFFVTNESIIQQIQGSLFSHDEKTFALDEVKDVSYSQFGLLQMIGNYGSIRITIEGDDTAYTLTNVAEPKKIATMLNTVIEDFKGSSSMSEPSAVN